MTDFSQNFRKRAAHPHPIFLEVPRPPPEPMLQKVKNLRAIQQ